MFSINFRSKKIIIIGLILLFGLCTLVFFATLNRPATPTISSVLPLSQGQAETSRDSGFMVKGVNLKGASSINFYDDTNTLLAQISNPNNGNSQNNSIVVSPDGSSVQVVYGAFGGAPLAADLDLNMVKVRVVTPSGLSNAVPFTTLSIPTIDSINPNMMTVGDVTPIVFRGSNIISEKSTVEFDIDNQKFDVIVPSADQFNSNELFLSSSKNPQLASLPAGVYRVQIVNTLNGTITKSNSLNFTVTATSSPVVNTYLGMFCGGIAAVPCPTGYSCKLSSTHPDASGACVSTDTLPIILISASPENIDPGQPATITWSVENATRCTKTGAWSGTSLLTGSKTFTFYTSGPHTYGLKCTGLNGTMSDSTTVTVNSSNNTEINTDTTTIDSGQTTDIGTGTTNEAGPGNGRTNSPSAPILTLSVVPAIGATGDPVTLMWYSANATRCIASGSWSGQKSTDFGTESIAAPAAIGTYTYALACVGAGGTTTKSTAVTINSTGAGSGTGGGTNSSGAPLVTLYAVPATAAPGDPVTLMWSSVNTVNCAASGEWSGSKSADISLQIESVTAPTAPGTYTYTLTCIGASGTATQSSTVTVSLAGGGGTGGTGAGGNPNVGSTGICIIPGQNTPRQVEIVSLCQAAKLIRDVVVTLANSKFIYKPMLATTRYLSNQLVDKLTDNLTQGEINNAVTAMITALHMELVNQSAFPAFTKTLQDPVNTTLMMLDTIHKFNSGVGYQ